MIKYVQLFVMILSTGILYSQDCKVLMKSINDSYTGECKRGKAHGKGLAKGVDTYEGEFRKGVPHGFGVYTWQDGNVYEGEFKKGEKEGQGKLIKKDTTIIGFWKKDEYKGAYEKPYKLNGKSTNVSAVNLYKVQDDINNIRFYIKSNQDQVQGPQLNVVVHSGQYQTSINNSNFFELTNVTYPIKFKAYYQRDFIEVEIYEPGLWEIKTDITLIKGLN